MENPALFFIKAKYMDGITGELGVPLWTEECVAYLSQGPLSQG